MTAPADVAVRTAAAADLEPMVALLGELFAIEADFTFDPDRQRAGLARLMAAPAAAALVAQRGPEVVGMATAQLVVSTAEGAPSAWIEDVVVASSWRGHGIGACLVEAAVAWAAGRGATRCQLLADRFNAPALAFYRRLGWTSTRMICLRRGAAPGRLTP